MRRRWIAAGVLLLLLAVTGIVRLGLSSAARNRLRQMRHSVVQLRTAADSCSADLSLAQIRLVAYRARLDSLHTGVREFEAADPRGVPADRYDDYMQAFTRYNDSAAAWDGRVNTLQARLEACQSISHQHNEAVDSLRVLLSQP